MMTIGFIIDTVLVVVFMLFVVTDYKKGFLYAVGETVSVFLASIFASLLSTPLADFIYNHAVAPNVIREVQRLVSGNAITNEQASELFDQFPQFVQNALISVGVSKETITYTVNQTGESVPNAVETLVKPYFLNFITVLLSVILFFVLMSVLFFVVRLLTKSINFMGLGIVNRLAGAVVGIVKAAFLFMIVALVLYLCISIMPTDTATAIQEQIECTTIFKFFFNFNIPSAIISGLANIDGVALF
ncbi:MAG: CvpA family protein [Acutalibacteraceae bacterium]